MIARILTALLLGAATPAAMAADCDAIHNGAVVSGRSLLGSEAVKVTVGEGRLPFHSAPNEECRDKGVFVLPGELLVATWTYGDFTFVHYENTRTGRKAEGWVDSSRLKWTGYGIDEDVMESYAPVGNFE